MLRPTPAVLYGMTRGLVAAAGVSGNSPPRLNLGPTHGIVFLCTETLACLSSEREPSASPTLEWYPAVHSGLRRVGTSPFALVV